MMQAFNKKFDNLQKDLDKVKRNQAGIQQNTRISDIKKDTGCFKCGQKGHWKMECKRTTVKATTDRGNSNKIRS